MEMIGGERPFRESFQPDSPRRCEDTSITSEDGVGGGDEQVDSDEVLAWITDWERPGRPPLESMVNDADAAAVDFPSVSWEQSARLGPSPTHLTLHSH